MPNQANTVDGATEQPADIPPPALVLGANTRATILIEAYKRHAASLEAIETSQQQLTLLILGAYSAGLTFMSAYIHDGKKLDPRMAIALIGAAVLLAAYGSWMSRMRGRARHEVREGVLRIDHALGFFEPGLYLEGEPLYPDAWKRFHQRRGVLTYLPLAIPLAALAFGVLVVIAL
jgi:hypothetical protein